MVHNVWPLIAETKICEFCIGKLLFTYFAVRTNIKESSFLKTNSWADSKSKLFLLIFLMTNSYWNIISVTLNFQASQMCHRELKTMLIVPKFLSLWRVDMNIYIWWKSGITYEFRTEKSKLTFLSKSIFLYHHFF